jgi:glutathione S-transferase
MLRLYDFLPSGNGYKVRLLLTQLGIPFERVELNILNGETRTPEFLSKNPNGRIPVLELEPGKFLILTLPNLRVRKPQYFKNIQLND